MKKVISAMLIVLMLVSLTACGANTSEPLKFGLGITAAYGEATSADGETAGKAEVDVTAAAVLLDADGKIVQLVIDAAQNTASYTAEGKAVVSADFKTKLEKGAEYGMSQYGKDLNGDGVVKEWNEQVAAFIGQVKGKTVDEVKAMVVDGYGNDAIQTAGCTIAVAEFVPAIEKAVANAKESAAVAENTLNLGVVTAEEAVDAAEEKEGTIEQNINVTAAVLDQDGKVVVAATDAAQVKFGFDTKGAATTDTAATLKTKGEKGTEYGMSQYGKDLNGDGVVKEWNEQAAAFDAALTGKTAAEIGGLAVDGYGVEELQTAGCTIAISDMVAAAVKAATVA